jgi:hypothetical protein
VNWGGLAAAFLALGIAAAVAGTLIIVALRHGTDPADAELINAASTLGAAALGAVVGWLARSGRDGR